MFGQAPSTSPFGTPGTTPGGTSLFGAPAASAFGSPAPAFGAPAATPSTGGFGFGSPAPAPSTGFGGFGSTTPAPAPAGFGAFSATTPAPAFGAPASGTPFGAPAPSGGLFGSTPAPAPSGGLFGGGATTSGFGSATAAPAFGAPTTTSAFGAPATSTFGAPAPTTSAFGTTSTFGSSPAPSTGLFGAPAPATSSFGAPAPSAFGAPASSSGLFGAPTPAPVASTGLFGAPAAGGQRGTLQTPYSDTRINDGNSIINFKSISGMQAYSNHSFEELRIADYMAGNKGAQGQNIGGTTAFGAPTTSFGSPAPAPTGGLFGASTPAPSAFGVNTTSAFGSTPATTFGSPSAAPSAFSAPAPAPSGGLFGAPTPSATPAFGSQATTPSAFGASPAPSGGLFGAPAPATTTGGLFGSTSAAPAPSTGFSFGASAPTPATGAFGSTPAPATGGLFGSSSAPTPSGGLFGAPAPAPSGGLFGAPAPAPSGGLFGSPAPAPSSGLFGAPAPTTGGLFGAPSPAPVAGGGLFGAPAPAPAAGGFFGAPAPAPATGGLFGTSAPKPAGGLFGAPAPAGGLFGSSTPAPAFGAAPTSSMFGATAPGTAPVATTSVLVPPSADTLLAHQLAAVEAQKKEMAVLEALRGTSPGSRSASSSGSVIPTSIFQRDAVAVRYRGLAGVGGHSQAASSYPLQIAPRSTAKIRPRGFGPPTPSTALQLTSAQERVKPMTPSAFIGSGTKHLVIKPGSLTPKPKMRLFLSDKPTDSNKLQQKDDGVLSQPPSTNAVFHGSVLDNEKSKTPLSQQKEASPTQGERPTPFDVSKIANEEAAFTSPAAVSKDLTKSTSGKKTKTPKINGESYEYYRTVIGSPGLQKEKSGTETVSPRSLVPKLSKEGYIVTPSMSHMLQMTEAELATVSNFVVEKVGVGSVAWDGAVDVRGIDLDSIISIEMKDVAVYQKQEEMGTKPPEGTKLNRSAVITFHGVYPKGGQESSEEMKKKFEQKLQKNAKIMGAEFIMYDGDTGIWMFRVPHFSRYALKDDSDDENDEGTSSSMDFEPGVDGGSTQYSIGKGKQIKRARLSRIRVPLNEDEDMVEYVNENDINHAKEEKNHVLEAAEAAYQKMAINHIESESEYFEKKRSTYTEEGDTVSPYNTDAPVRSHSSSTPRGFSICDKIALQSGIKLNQTSSIDYSRRLGKSFRVGWKPDGSFLFPTQSSKIVQARPLTHYHSSSSLKLLFAHKESSRRICTEDNIPFFCIPNLAENSGKSRLINISKAYASICKQISKTTDNTIGVVGRAFCLIHLLFLGGRQNDEMSRNFTKWLKDLSQTTGKFDASTDSLVPVFDTLSCGNLREASLLARKAGYFSLSSIIANTAIQSISELEDQIHSWIECGSEQFMPLHLYRIFSLMCGDLTLEENLYEKSGPSYEHALDWKRRLTMLDKCETVSSDRNPQIINLMKKYDINVEKGKAPPPNAWYIGSREPGYIDKNNEHNCILYRLLRLFCDESMRSEESMKLSYIISPLGHTSFVHDVSHSFHLASILSSLQLRSCVGLSDSEECKLLESYALSLIDSGNWEWAIYVILCTFSTNNGISKEIAKWKKATVIEIICRNCNDSVDSNQRREFLETELLIPQHWFDLAHSYRSINSIHRNVFQMSSKSALSPQMQQIFENMILPVALFDADKHICKDLLAFLEKTQDEVLSWTRFDGLLLEYLRLSQVAMDLSDGLLQNCDINFEELIAKSEDIAVAISKVDLESGIGLENSTVPGCIVLSEFDSAVRNLIVQLNVLKGGGSILENQKVYGKTEQNVLKIMSKLAYQLANNDTQIASTKEASSLLRGKCGVEVSILS